jgi:hypothetical protein
VNSAAIALRAPVAIPISRRKKGPTGAPGVRVEIKLSPAVAAELDAAARDLDLPTATVARSLLEYAIAHVAPQREAA